jgi:hypothetical protein
VKGEVAKQKQFQKKVNYAAGKINVKIIRSRGKEYRQRWVYVPAQLIDSGTFPFADNEPVLLVVDSRNEQVIIQKLRPQLPR